MQIKTGSREALLLYLYGYADISMRTGESVQTWIGDDVPADNGDIIYESLRCPLCGHVHLVNRSTGRALGGDNEAASVGGR